MSELSRAIGFARGDEPLPMPHALPDGTERLYQRSPDPSGPTVVRVLKNDVRSDPALAWVRSVGTDAGDVYDVTDEAWLRHDNS